MWSNPAGTERIFFILLSASDSPNSTVAVCSGCFFTAQFSSCSEYSKFSFVFVAFYADGGIFLLGDACFGDAALLVDRTDGALACGFSHLSDYRFAVDPPAKSVCGAGCRLFTQLLCDARVGDLDAAV